MLDLACLDQFLDRTRDIFDRHIRIDTMLVEQVYRIRSQPLERGLGDRLDMLRAAVQTAATRSRYEINVEAELGRNDDPSLERHKRFAYQFLIDKWTVGLGSIEEGHATIYCCTDEGDHLPFVGRRAVGGAHTHAAEPKG